MTLRPRLPLLFPLLASLTVVPAVARAQGEPTGAPPPDAKALAAAPKAPSDAPKVEKSPDGTTITASAGGVLATGNSRMLALTGSGAFDWRGGYNGVGASLLGNYGEAATPGNARTANAENLQGRLRYDRYIIDQASVFLMVTGRHDRFQGLDFRLNIDPGLKYLFVNEAATALWAEAGYDFQYDVRRNAARVVLDASGAPVLDANGQPTLLDKTATDHSTRLFAGFRHAFNKEVTFSTGLEYLQSVVDATRYRLNYDALAAAKIGGGFALGFGFSLRYDHEPLPGKEKTDTTTSMSLIYAFSDIPEAPTPPTCPCPEATPPPVVAPAAPPPPASSATPAPASESTPAPAPEPSPVAPPPSTGPSPTTGGAN